MSNISTRHGSSSYIEKNQGFEYIFYIDMLFICKQVFDIDLHDFHIRDDKGNKIFDNALTL
jgi:hypothetical protein